jgi:hypothetical protein
MTLLTEDDSIDTRDAEPFTTSESSTKMVKAEVGYIVCLTPWNCVAVRNVDLYVESAI